jgi:hypothetical protein
MSESREEQRRGQETGIGGQQNGAGESDTADQKDVPAHDVEDPDLDEGDNPT